jgi:putative MATE family efflux protein
MDMKKINFLKEFLSLSLPLIIQNILFLLVTTIDIALVSLLQEDYIVAVGFAHKFTFIYEVSMYGIFSGITIFISQYYAKKYLTQVRRIFALLMLLSIIVGILFNIIGFLFAETFMVFFSKDLLIIQKGSEYLKVVSFSYLFMALSYAFMLSMRAMGHMKQALIITIFAVIINTVVSYILILGKFNIPSLDVKGAAIGTIISLVFQFSSFLYIFIRYGYNLKTSIKNYYGLSKNLLFKMIKISIPIFLTDIIWVIGSTILLFIYSKSGTKSSVAVEIQDIILSISGIIFYGVANASSIIISQYLGAGYTHKTFKVSQTIFKIIITLSIVLSLGTYLSKDIIVAIFNLTPSTAKITEKVLLVSAIFIFFKMINWMITVGILRAGGDTKYAFFLDTSFLFLLGIPLAYIGMVYYNLEIHWVMLLANLEEVIKLGFVLQRYYSQKWVKDLTKDTI